jgi:hypothetical protein
MNHFLLMVVAMGITMTQMSATTTTPIKIFILQFRHHISRYT